MLEKTIQNILQFFAANLQNVSFPDVLKVTTWFFNVSVLQMKIQVQVCKIYILKRFFLPY